MPTIISPRAFFLLLKDEVRIPIKKGAQVVEADIAAHPFIKATCEIVEEVAEKAADLVEHAVAEVAEAIVPAEPPKAPEAPKTFNDLAVKATGLGIKVDGRWGIERLKAEIAAKESVVAANTKTPANQGQA